MKKGAAFKQYLILVVIGVALDLVGSVLADALSLPLFLDTIGTVLVAALGGIFPGVIVGFAVTVIGALVSPATLYFAWLNMFIAVVVGILTRRGALTKIPQTALAALFIALVCGTLGSLMSWAIAGMSTGSGTSEQFVHAIEQATGWSALASQFVGDGCVEFADKFATVLIAYLMLRRLPQSTLDLFANGPLAIYRRLGVTDEDLVVKSKDDESHRNLSLSTKTTILATLTIFIVGGICLSVSFNIYRSTTVTRYEEIANTSNALAATLVDADEIDTYLSEGASAPGYQETLQALSDLSGRMEGIKYLYVYQIRADGCHVVFDTDTNPETAGIIGDVLPIEEFFSAPLSDLLAGKNIEPRIDSGTYGWLLTSYLPLFDSNGACVAYVCTDIDMMVVLTDWLAFVAKVASFIFTIVIFLSVVISSLTRYHVIRPINRLSQATEDFAFDSNEGRSSDLSELHSLDIRTGDEVEHLYQAVVKMTDDATGYISEIDERNEQIAHQVMVIRKMQDNTIASFADLIDARDKLTGGHIQRTAAYMKLLGNAALDAGCYPETVTPAYVNDLIRSAPLHDIGKIEISDTLLNKPGSFTDEEYEIMKTHAPKGGVILRRVLKGIDEEDSGYLDMAVDMATYHHERWDGGGYPEGLAGTAIPLCARFMAIPDVFDALSSKRSYKDNYDFAKCMAIMAGESGKAFDPKLLAVFLGISYQIGEMQRSFTAEETTGKSDASAEA